MEEGEIDNVSYASATNRFLPVTGGVNPLGDGSNEMRGNNVYSNTTSAQNRRHPQSSSSTRNRVSANSRGNVRNNSSSDIRPRKSEFLVKNSKQVTVVEEGGAGIPFSALRELHRYKAFVTNLCPNTNIQTICRHINSILGVNCTIKAVSSLGVPHLSLILMFTSESDTLDLKMTGLWPNGTVIEKCIPQNQRKRKGSRSNQGTTPRGSDHRQGDQYQPRPTNQQGYGLRNRTDSTRNQEGSNSSVHVTPDQDRLRQQWIRG